MKKRNCKHCNNKIDNRNKTGICNDCWIKLRTKFPGGKKCLDCGKILAHTKSERCHRCFSKSLEKPHFCIDCGKKMISYYAKRCKQCNLKFIHVERKRCNICNKFIDQESTNCSFCNGKLHSLRLKGRKLPQEQKIKIGISSKLRWQNKEYKDKVLRKIYESNNRFPNKVEQTVLKLIYKNYKYVGNGQVILEGLNPDFIDIKNKKIIEVYGDYWHNRESYKKRDKRRLEVYSKYNYKTLVIWEHELKDLNKVKEKINKFNYEK